MLQFQSGLPTKCKKLTLNLKQNYFCFNWKKKKENSFIGWAQIFFSIQIKHFMDNLVKEAMKKVFSK